MYKPVLRYAFCLMRPHSLWSQLFLMKYLNAKGIEPYVMWDKRYQVEIVKKLTGIRFKEKRPADNQMDYDIMFSESSGYTSFEKISLRRSKEKGKINIKLNNSISTYNRIINTCYTPNRTKDTLDGIYLKGQRSVKHFEKFVDKKLFFISGGDPDWDWFKTEDFKFRVEQAKKKYGGPFFLLGTSVFNKEEIEWFPKIIKWTKKKGFRLVIQVHPGRESRMPEPFQKYMDLETPRYILSAAASHSIINISSSMIAECLLFGNRVGCTAAITHFIGYSEPHMWFNNYEKWKKFIMPKIGEQLFNMVPRVTNEDDLDTFLSSDKSFATPYEIDKLFGWQRKPCYCEHLFKEVEKKVRTLL